MSTAYVRPSPAVYSSEPDSPASARRTGGSSTSN